MSITTEVSLLPNCTSQSIFPYFTLWIQLDFFGRPGACFFVSKAWHSQWWHWNDRRNGGNKRGCRLWICLVCLHCSTPLFLSCSALGHCSTSEGPTYKENAKFFSFDAKMLSASGGFAPWPSDQGLCPWTPLGALPPDPHRLALSRSPLLAFRSLFF